VPLILESMKELLKFMATFFAEKEVWISKDIEMPKETDGFKFKHKDTIKGVVIFGDRYPLSNADMTIDEHLSVWSAIKNTDSFGMVFNQEGEGQKMYMSTKGDVSFL
jgi:hypothetical protein